MGRSRMRRCSTDFDDLVKQQKVVWEQEAQKLGKNINISETDVTSIFTKKLKKHRIQLKEIEDLI